MTTTQKDKSMESTYRDIEKYLEKAINAIAEGLGPERVTRDEERILSSLLFTVQGAEYLFWEPIMKERYAQVEKK